MDYGEMVTLEYALANSMNTVTAKLIKDYGVHRVVDLAHAMGIQSDIPAVPSIALGVAELSLAGGDSCQCHVRRWRGVACTPHHPQDRGQAGQHHL